VTAYLTRGIDPSDRESTDVARLSDSRLIFVSSRGVTLRGPLDPLCATGRMWLCASEADSETLGELRSDKLGGVEPPDW
jgi:hypothetical protein